MSDYETTREHYWKEVLAQDHLNNPKQGAAMVHEITPPPFVAPKTIEEKIARVMSVAQEEGLAVTALKIPEQDLETLIKSVGNLNLNHPLGQVTVSK